MDDLGFNWGKAWPVAFILVLSILPSGIAAGTALAFLELGGWEESHEWIGWGVFGLSLLAFALYIVRVYVNEEAEAAYKAGYRDGREDGLSTSGRE